MRAIRFDLQQASLEYYFRECYQAFDPGVKTVLVGEANGILTQRYDDNSFSLTLEWKEQKSLTRVFHYQSEILDASICKGFLYDLLVEYFNRELKWGTLTGIKPVKNIQNYLKSGMKPIEIKQKFKKQYRVSSDRIELLLELAKRQEPILTFENRNCDKNGVSLYIGIPLCPAKCSYCSFISTIVSKDGVNLKTYFNNLLLEITDIGDYLTKHGVWIDTLYIGGGTPTVLSAEQLNELMHLIEQTFNLSKLREYTLEAGRVETITEEKLCVAKKYGVHRICLNPQSMNKKTLLSVGRYFEKGLIEKKRELIKSIGFESLNMDLIIGLSDEKLEDFYYSLDSVIALNPENITIHNLSIKKGSILKHDNGIKIGEDYGEDFYQKVKKKLKKNRYDPYYLYRLKYTNGNNENIGYSKPGYEGIYNILMMAERQSVIGIGAGSTGKLYDPETDSMKRVFTVKDIKTYNDRIEEIIDKKKCAYQFFE
jgi:oxygen-independent coproporphyrinogen-3 oxidase